MLFKIYVQIASTFVFNAHVTSLTLLLFGVYYFKRSECIFCPFNKYALQGLIQCNKQF